ncbi:MAG: RNA methyltransferase [Anaerolineales bacterium]|nr:RNA methyltransferase [Anaerolineales bacterium]
METPWHLITPAPTHSYMLTSTSNDKVKHVRALQARSRNRREVQAFVVEGVRLVEEALKTGWDAQFIFYTDDLNQRGQEIVDAFRQVNVDVVPVSPEVMRAASDTQTPQGILAVLPMAQVSPPTDLNFVLLLDNVRDPGNMGTLLRTALAAKVDVVLLPPGNVDPYAPKVLRAGMGAHFSLPIQTGTWDEVREMIEPLQVFLSEVAGVHIYSQTDLTVPLALIIGGEAQGAGPEARSLGGQTLNIPMPGGIESLNASAAGAILMFEIVRQRQ